MHVLLADGSIPWMLVAGIVAGLALALLAGVARARLAHRSVRALLHPLAGADGRLAIYLQGLFVPGHEYYSRAPEDQRHPAGADRPQVGAGGWGACGGRRAGGDDAAAPPGRGLSPRGAHPRGW
ncbi:MAG: hypothetical protein IPG75_20640 [Gemmatimonadetes bacterium]|nr:hypothetical protein [Gemmatimonadota bacterium]